MSRAWPPYFAGTLTTVESTALLADLLRDGSGLDVHVALEWNLPGVLAHLVGGIQLARFSCLSPQ